MVVVNDVSHLGLEALDLLLNDGFLLEELKLYRL
jgi:hypothetical protein